MTCFGHAWTGTARCSGRRHAETLLAAASLAVSLRKAGEQAEAMALAQDTYRRYRNRLAPDGPDAQPCALDLAWDYAAVDDLPGQST